MISLISNSIFLWYVVTVASKSINTTQLNATKVNATEIKELEQKIDALEKEKDELLNKINLAIDESIKALEHVNDSDSIDGRQYLMELKKQMKALDEADPDEDSDENNVTKSGNYTNEGNDTDAEFRRFGGFGRRKTKSKSIKSLLAERMEFKKTYKKPTAFMHTAQHVKVEKDIRAWLEMKAEEKRKIQEYRLKRKLETSYYELCPRFGEKKKKKKDKKSKNKNGPRRVLWPCCRKCCKKSYLGCLK